MKIIFICSSLEPGRDGVGDYTSRLAFELIRQAHTVAIISLNDKHTPQKICGVQQSGHLSIPTLRLPAIWKIKDRLNSARKYIEDFNPNWLSLQFVVFGYHAKGLPFGLAKTLASIGPGRKWHIMFHELWVQAQLDLSLKAYLWGRAQRYLIMSIVTTVKPHTIHTNTFLYQQQLAKIGIDSLYLPLFSNIPNINPDDKEKSAISNKKSASDLRLVIFGLIHSNTPVAEFVREATAYSKKNDIKIFLDIVGRNGTEKEIWISLWKAAGMEVNILGELNPAGISASLSNASFGISTTPVPQLGKSGSSAAMLEHELTVIAVSPPWKIKNDNEMKTPEGFRVYEKGNLGTILSSQPTVHTTNNVSNVAQRFIDSLQ